MKPLRDRLRGRMTTDMVHRPHLLVSAALLGAALVLTASCATTRALWNGEPRRTVEVHVGHLDAQQKAAVVARRGEPLHRTPDDALWYYEDPGRWGGVGGKVLLTPFTVAVDGATVLVALVILNPERAIQSTQPR